MVEIIKASGEKVPFDKEKLRRSLHRVSKDDQLIQQIIDDVQSALHPDMSTRTIYKIAFKFLKRKSLVSAGRYHLKRAIMHLGVSGYPFEKYFAALLQDQGYKTRNNQTVNGFCISHEVDVVAERENKKIIVECKYHRRQGLKCDVTISLYFSARFMDIKQADKNNSDLNLEGWLVTNTRFTTDAMKYGRCAKLHLMAWDYPENGGLKELIESTGLYPVTCISNLTKAEMMLLIESNIILCKSVLDNTKILDHLKIPSPRRATILEQCRTLCSQ